MTYTTKSSSNTGFTLAAAGDTLTVSGGGSVFNDTGNAVSSASYGTVNDFGHNFRQEILAFLIGGRAISTMVLAATSLLDTVSTCWETP